MTLRFHAHPLASFCHKALIALYENDTPFEHVMVDFGDERSASAFRALWPLAKMPVLEDTARGQMVAEASAVIDYVDRWYPGPVRLLPLDADLAWKARMLDSVFDSYVHEPMQKIVTDRLRRAGRNDPEGVEQAAAQIRQAYDWLEGELAGRRWALGEDFSAVDCAAAPALFYADMAVPLRREHTWLANYLERLMARPSYARVLEEAAPWFVNFPLPDKPVVLNRRAWREGKWEQA